MLILFLKVSKLAKAMYLVCMLTFPLQVYEIAILCRGLVYLDVLLRTWCVNIFPTSFRALLTSVGLSLHALVRLWECSGRVAWMLAIGFLVAHAVVLAFAGLAIKQVRGV